MTTAKMTKHEVELLRGELFHMILFSLAWVLIGEYVLDFSDYCITAVIGLSLVLVLAFYSIKLYDLEYDLEKDLSPVFVSDKIVRSDRLYALILLFEGVAVLITWIILLKIGHDEWVVTAFAFIAGLHFFPLAHVVRLRSYYMLGVWICLLAGVGYWLLKQGSMPGEAINAMIAYGCTAGALLDGLFIMFMTKGRLRKGGDV